MTSRASRLARLALATMIALPAVAGAGGPFPTDDRGRPLYEPGELYVKLLPGVQPKTAALTSGRFGLPALDALADELGVHHVEAAFRLRATKRRADLPDLSRVYRVGLSTEVDLRAAAARLGEAPGVEYAEPIPSRFVDETPDDPYFTRQSFLKQIEAEGAWDVHKGEEGPVEVVVGIVDSGVAWRHEDLADNIHQNLGEDADGDGQVIERSGSGWSFDHGDENGVDDDGNGYVDDFVGWDFYDNDEGEDNDPDDPGQHGTHVSGLAAARTDNATGVASISWNVKLLPTSTANVASGDTLPRTLEGIVYAAENGADVINMSFGGPYTSQTEIDALAYAEGLGSILVAAAGNDDSADLHYPSALPGVISVASVQTSDIKARYSNYGISVDVAAPGGGGAGGQIYSTIPTGYGYMQGTSMACPVVSGLFALVKSAHPDWTNDQLVTQLLATADSVDDANPVYAGQLGSGRINALRALTETAVVADPELKLALEKVEIVDDTGDGSIEAGEQAELGLKIRNYSELTGSEALTLTLSTDSPYLELVDPEVTVSFPPDAELELPAAFTVRALPGAPSGLYAFTIAAAAPGVGISDLSTLDLRLTVANGGILVWEGAEEATFSGRYLRDALTGLGFEVVYSSGEFPPGLVGFDAAFLCFGNAGLAEAARIDSAAKVETIEGYLESGGRLYLEGSDSLGWDIYNLVDGTPLLPLFGLEGGVDGDTNPIDSLDGQSGSLTEGLRFTGTSQDPVEWIDIFTPSADGVTAFVESGYGTVAVEHQGAFGQRTFCFSYALGELSDGASTRADLLARLLDFFRLVTPAERMRPRSGGERVRP